MQQKIYIHHYLLVETVCSCFLLGKERKLRFSNVLDRWREWLSGVSSVNETTFRSCWICWSSCCRIFWLPSSSSTIAFFAEELEDFFWGCCCSIWVLELSNAVIYWEWYSGTTVPANSFDRSNFRRSSISAPTFRVELFPYAFPRLLSYVRHPSECAWLRSFDLSQSRTSFIRSESFPRRIFWKSPQDELTMLCFAVLRREDCAASLFSDLFGCVISWGILVMGAIANKMCCSSLAWGNKLFGFFFYEQWWGDCIIDTHNNSLRFSFCGKRDVQKIP